MVPARFNAILLICIFFNFGCSKNIINKQPITYQKKYFHRINSNRKSIVFGQINEIQYNKKIIPVPHAVIAIGNELVSANDSGIYAITLSPGNHLITAGRIGFYKSSTIISTSQGDSINLDFNLKAWETKLPNH